MSTKKMTRFDFAHKATKEMVSIAKMPLIKKSVKRAFDSAADSINDTILDLEEKVDTLRTSLYTSDRSADKSQIMTDLIEARMAISDARQSLIILENEESVMAEEIEVDLDSE